MQKSANSSTLSSNKKILHVHSIFSNWSISVRRDKLKQISDLSPNNKPQVFVLYYYIIPNQLFNSAYTYYKSTIFLCKVEWVFL